jgi:hypothetical protein
MATPSLRKWPNSDVRLDCAHGYGADLDENVFNELSGMPLVTAFGVRDNGVIKSSSTSDIHIEYNWALNCSGTHPAHLGSTQVQHVQRFNPSFGTGIYIPTTRTSGIRFIDAPAHYTRFVKYFKAQNPTTLMGSYISAIVCVKGLTHPHTERFYPQGAVDAYRLDLRGPERMGTPPFIPIPNCPLNPGRWLANLDSPRVRQRFREEVIRIVRETKPKPPFVYIDNVLYIQNDPWAHGTPQTHPVDCRDRGSASNTACKQYRGDLALEVGPNIHFDDLITHYGALVDALEKEGVRSILNITATPSTLALPREAQKAQRNVQKDGYAYKLEKAIRGNGMAFEQPFHPNSRSVFWQTSGEIAMLRRLLSQGNLLVFYADYNSFSESSWMASMAMLIRERGQSLFLSRNQHQDPKKPRPPWLMWPSQYGRPTATAPTLQQVSIANPSAVAEHWTLSRTYRNGEIIAGSFGVKVKGTFDLAQLVPSLTLPQYQLLFQLDHPLKFGTWDNASKIYTAGSETGVDYLIFGAQPSSSGHYQKLIAISARIW